MCYHSRPSFIHTIHKHGRESVGEHRPPVQLELANWNLWAVQRAFWDFFLLLISLLPAHPPCGSSTYWLPPSTTVRQLWVILLGFIWIYTVLLPFLSPLYGSQSHRYRERIFRTLLQHGWKNGKALLLLLLLLVSTFRTLYVLWPGCWSLPTFCIFLLSGAEIVWTRLAKCHSLVIPCAASF